MQAGKVDAGPDDPGIPGSRLEGPPRGPGDIPAPGMGDHDIGRVFAVSLPDLLHQLVAEGLHSRDAEGAVQRGIKKSCLFK